LAGAFDSFVIDVETSGLATKTNEVSWVGLGCPDRSS
jgi:hypothetical protein